MKRRDFVSRVSLGAAVACTGFGRPAQAAAASQPVNVRFVGMMTFLERADRSFLVATPGQHALHHMMHVPFLMARAGSPIAKAFDMKPASGVVPAAFDTALVGTNPSEFVYRNLANTSLDILSGSADAVTNHADEMALMNRIAPNKRVRGNVVSQMVMYGDRPHMDKLVGPVKVQVDSFPGTYFDGVVEQVNRQAEFTPRNVQTVEDRIRQVFGVKIRLPNTDDRLRAGMAADVYFPNVK